MSHYIDGFVLPLSKDKIEEYRRISEKGGAIWREHGALDYRECIGDDLEVAEMVPFPKIAGAGADETVVFSWIIFESREHRDAVNAKVMADPRLMEMCDPENSPFDYKRMAYGGFRELVRA